MSLRKTLLICIAGWLLAITVLHGRLNLDWFTPAAKSSGAEMKFGVGFLPVTCHLTCPVTDFINKGTQGRSFFQPMRFNAFPELKEMFIGRPQEMPATFILAPMAMALREQGVKIKIVHLGHRDGSV